MSLALNTEGLLKDDGEGVWAERVNDTPGHTKGWMSGIRNVLTIKALSTT